MTKQIAQVQNGVKAPVRGVCRMAWDLFATADKYVAAGHVPAIAEKTGMNPENLRIELRRFKRFHGVKTGVRLSQLA